MKTANFNENKNYNEDKPAIKLILESESSKEIRIMMKKGQEMKKHQTAFPIVVHLISGAINFDVEGTTHALKTGAILSLNSNVPHSLSALEDSIVRLSLSKQDNVQRVETLVK